MSKSADRFKGTHKRQVVVMRDLELRVELGIAKSLAYLPEIEPIMLNEFFDAQELKQFKLDTE